MLQFTDGSTWSSVRGTTGEPVPGVVPTIDTGSMRQVQVLPGIVERTDDSPEGMAPLSWEGYDADTIFLGKLWEAGYGGHRKDANASSGGGAWYYYPHEYINMAAMPSNTPHWYPGAGKQASNSWYGARSFDRDSHSRMSLAPTPARLKLLHVCVQWHSSRVSTLHCLLP